MNNFLLVFRREDIQNEPVPSPEQLQSMMKHWQDWMGSLAAQNKLADAGNRLASEGRVVKANKVITNGPYVETKEAIGGYIVLKCESIDEAAQLSLGCPILNIGGNVEVRKIIPMEG